MIRGHPSGMLSPHKMLSMGGVGVAVGAFLGGVGGGFPIPDPTGPIHMAVLVQHIS